MRKNLKKQKGPIVDPTLRSVIDVIQESGMSITAISEKSGVSTTTMYNWQKGITRRPQNVTMDFVLKACGFERPPPRRIK